MSGASTKHGAELRIEREGEWKAQGRRGWNNEFHHLAHGRIALVKLQILHGGDVNLSYRIYTPSPPHL